MSMFERLLGGSRQSRFAKLTIRELAERGFTQPLRFDEPSFSLRRQDGSKHFLANIYAEWLREKDDANRYALFDSLYANLIEGEQSLDWESTANSLLPVVRNRLDIGSYWLNPHMEAKRQDWEGVYEPLVDPAAVYVAIDTPAGINLLANAALSELGVTFEEAFARAMSNLGRLSPPAFVRMPDRFWITDDGDLYDASRLLRPDWGAALPVTGRLVAIPLARNGVVAADLDDPEAVAAMAIYVETEAAENPRRISRCAMVRRGPGWTAAPTGMVPLDRLRQLQNLDHYASQQSLLNGYFEKTGRDVFVATMEGVSAEDGGIHTYATWSDVPTLLPHAEYIALNLDMKQVAIRRFEDVQAVAGEMMTREDFDPPRWFVPSGISSKAFERLRRDYPAAPFGR